MSDRKLLDEKTAQWMSLERKTLEQRKAADDFYDTEMMSLIGESFTEHNKGLVSEQVDHLMVSVGTFYAPAVLTFKLLRPSHICFLYTQASSAALDKVLKYCDPEPGSYEVRLVDETDSLDIYQKIKRIHRRWGKPERLYIDITGGTNAMSSACALAGAMLDAQLICIGSQEYLPDLGRPRPGSEAFMYIENPMAVFCDREIGKAFELFEKLDFPGATERLHDLKERIPDPTMRQQVEFVYLLSKAYEAWDSLDFVKAEENMVRLYDQIMRDTKTHREYLMMDLAEKIFAQKEILGKLAKIPELQRSDRNEEILRTPEVMHALMFTLYQSAMTREKHEKYDMATLLLYRLLEMIEQRRLIRYDLYASSPVYTDLRFDCEILPQLKEMKTAEERVDWLQNEVYAIRQQIFQKFSPRLPAAIALLDGYTILAALRDPLLASMNIAPVNMLRRIRGLDSLRDNSIFAHGLVPVAFKDYEKFRDLVAELFKAYCQIEEIPFEETSESFAWIDPMGSANVGLY